jgi:hypothetical protein
MNGFAGERQHPGYVAVIRQLLIIEKLVRALLKLHAVNYDFFKRRGGMNMSSHL